FRASLAPVLAAGDWDLVHSHHWFSGAAALPVAQKLGLPHLQSFHSVAAPDGSQTLDAGEPAESSGRIPGERYVSEHSDLVVAVSAAEARIVQERYGVPGERLAVVRPGVDVQRFRPGDSSPGARLDSPTLLFPARPQDFEGYLAQLRELATQLGVSDRVEILGSVGREQLAELMRSSTMLLLTSWSETFGLVALEAQASGTPTVAWRCAGGVQEAIAPGGLALDSRDPDVWAEAVQSLLGDSGRYAEAVASARDFATDRTWTASASALATQYARLLDETPDVKEIP